MCKKLLVFTIMLLLSTTLCSCGKYSSGYPRIDIIRSDIRFDDISLKPKNGYNFAETIYTTQETENGYDIIIHFAKAGDTD